MGIKEDLDAAMATHDDSYAANVDRDQALATLWQTLEDVFDPLVGSSVHIDTTAPTVDDDTSEGFSVGDRWIDTAGDDTYTCVDATNGAAVWVQENGGGGGGTPASTVVAERTLNHAVSVVGTSTDFARADHSHGTPAMPSAADVGADPAGTASAAVTTHVGLSDPHSQYQKESEKGNANGYAGLDSGGTVPAAQLPGATTSTQGAVVLATPSADTTAGRAVQASDARLSDARTPTGAAGGDLAGTYPNPTIDPEAVFDHAALYTPSLIYGDGGDGDATISVDTTLAEPKCYDDLTINAGIVLSCAGFPLKVRGTLTLGAGAIIQHNGSNASGASLGAGAGTAALGGGGNGASGGAGGGAGSAASSLASSWAAMRAAGQTGGAGGSDGGANAGGAATAPAVPASAARRNIGFLAYDCGHTLGNAGLIQLTGGNGGSSGGGSGAGATRGAGGGGGGVCLIAARHVDASAGGAIIRANGGNGGNAAIGGAATGAGGGGGGQGGAAILVYLTHNTLPTVQANGGSGGTGAGTGNPGSTGGTGYAAIFRSL